MVLMGIIKMALACLLGPSLMNALEPFPSSVLGVLLAISGLELAVACRDVIGRREAAVMLLGAGLVLKHGTGAGFVGSILAALLLRARREEP